MIGIYTLLKQNASSFCLSHYLNYDVFKDNLDPKYAMYYQRKYDCLEATGIPKGREYCQAIFDKTEGWKTENLFQCYRRNQVDFSEDYCKWKFNVTAAAAESAEKETAMKKELVRCYGNKGVKMDMAICQSINTEQADIIKCYNDVVPNREICKAKYDFYQTAQDPAKVAFWTPSDYQECLTDAGYTLDKAYCDNYYTQPSQMDDRYSCYTLIDLKDVSGNPLKKDRTYCELKNPT